MPASLSRDSMENALASEDPAYPSAKNSGRIFGISLPGENSRQGIGLAPSPVIVDIWLPVGYTWWDAHAPEDQAHRRPARPAARRTARVGRAVARSILAAGLGLRWGRVRVASTTGRGAGPADAVR